MILEIVSGNEDFTTSRWHGVTQPSGTILSRDSSISRFEHVRTWTNGYGSRSRITIINPTKTDDLPRNQHLWAVAHRRDRRLETGQIGQAPYPGSVDHHSSGFDGRKSGGRPKYVDTTWNHTRSCCRVFVLNVFFPDVFSFYLITSRFPTFLSMTWIAIAGWQKPKKETIWVRVKTLASLANIIGECVGTKFFGNCWSNCSFI